MGLSKGTRTLKTKMKLFPHTGIYTWSVYAENLHGHMAIGVGTDATSAGESLGQNSYSWSLTNSETLLHKGEKVKNLNFPPIRSGDVVHVKYDSDKGDLYFAISPKNAAYNEKEIKDCVDEAGKKK